MYGAVDAQVSLADSGTARNVFSNLGALSHLEGLRTGTITIVPVYEQNRALVVASGEGVQPAELDEVVSRPRLRCSGCKASPFLLSVVESLATIRGGRAILLSVHRCQNGANRTQEA